ncbi:MAG: FecR domain-containing protein [Mucilaginibacter sp.]|uniref:FecR family protein n=1 Tax=Mucilaginibacter sp. TaxID=1882438 RepID=UPI003263443A
MNNPLTLAALFVKYLKNECSPGEIKQLLAYFNEKQNEETLRELIQAELGATDQNIRNQAKADAAVLKVRSTLVQQLKEKPAIKIIQFSKWRSLAAAGIFLIGSAAFIANHYWHGIEHYIHPVKIMELTTIKGQRRIITLSDGTKIWLSPSSTLEYPDQLTGNYREVKLEGEAFFEVAKDKKHPFVIHSGRMDTRVVGTSFMIRAYKEQLKPDVTVVTGIVKVSVMLSPMQQAEEIVLKPNHRGVFDQQKGLLTCEDYPGAGQMLKRKDGILTYDGAPVEEVAADFSRYYNLQIQIENKAKNCLCYGEFDMNKPINITLAQLAAAINASVIKQKDKYMIKGGCEE